MTANLFFRAAGLFLLLLSLAACSTQTKITTYPRAYRVLIDGKDRGESPATLVLGNRAFGDYTIALVDDAGNEVFRQLLPMDVIAWGIFWPPFGFFYNLFAASPEYEIDVSATAVLAGQSPSLASDERENPVIPSKNAAVNIWTNIAFNLLDKGWLREARFYLELSLRVDAKYPDAMLGMAIYTRKKGEDEAAQEWLDRYLAARGK